MEVYQETYEGSKVQLGNVDQRLNQGDLINMINSLSPNANMPKWTVITCIDQGKELDPRFDHRSDEALFFKNLNIFYNLFYFFPDFGYLISSRIDNHAIDRIKGSKRSHKIQLVFP